MSKKSTKSAPQYTDLAQEIAAALAPAIAAAVTSALAPQNAPKSPAKFAPKETPAKPSKPAEQPKNAPKEGAKKGAEQPKNAPAKKARIDTRPKKEPAGPVDEVLTKIARLEGVHATVKGAHTTAPVIWLDARKNTRFSSELAEMNAHWSKKRNAWYIGVSVA